MLFPNNELQIVVKYVEVGRGTVVVEIYDNAKNFLNKPVLTKTANASKECLQLNFDLPS